MKIAFFIFFFILILVLVVILFFHNLKPLKGQVSDKRLPPVLMERRGGRKVDLKLPERHGLII